MNFHFTSHLAAQFRPQLEEVLFFNPSQDRVEKDILAALGRHGMPTVVEANGRLTIRLKSGPESQSLFALADVGGGSHFAGVAVFSRVQMHTLLIIHLAIAGDFAQHGRYAQQLIVLRFMLALRQVARQLRGVKRLKLLYGADQLRDIPVGEETSPLRKLARISED
jgi:hypothetical protein